MRDWLRSMAMGLGFGKPAGPVPRSPHWPAIERMAFAHDGFACRACGRKRDLRGHHIRPFHLFPQLELVLENVITLCQPLGGGCHLHLGHVNKITGVCDWREWNPTVVADAADALARVGR